MTMIKDVVFERLKILYDENIDSLKKNNFIISFNERDFDISYLEGSYEDTIYTLIHHILYQNDLYKDFCNEVQMRSINKTMKVDPSLPPSIPEDSEGDNTADNLCGELGEDAIEFTYKYFKSHEIDCESYENYRDDYGLEWD